MNQQAPTLKDLRENPELYREYLKKQEARVRGYCV